MNKTKAFFIILGLFFVLLPALRLGWIYLNSLNYEEYSIEIESDKKVITRYVYDEKSDKKNYRIFLKIESSLVRKINFIVLLIIITQL